MGTPNFLQSYFFTSCIATINPQPLKGSMGRSIVKIIIVSTALLISAVVASHSCTTLTRMSILQKLVVVGKSSKARNYKYS